ncbi:MAG: gliding motility-associated C-terminal domain-containing protein [Bacteroidetes bacterium]|nr:gliding motility-associated C-terminal domain-containing protein [Bacteroidota bacterium]MBP6640760.1 gliding motility-associated C-terminal domain-containing protein [Bacteroidia bacterium]
MSKEGFAHNSDNKNDASQITWLPNTDPAAFVIHLFNGAGGTVLQMDGLHPNFDGSTLPYGVYWWVLEEAKSDKRAVQSGGLTIRRR